MKAGKLFSSLKQGDPQAVAIACGLFFLLAVSWFSWTLFTADNGESLPLAAGRPRPPLPTPTPLSAFIETQQNLKTDDKAPNPFFRNAPRERPTPGPDSVERNRPTPVAPPTPPPPPPTPTPQPPPPETVTYVFKGMIRRPYGETGALVGNAKNATSKYVKAGDELPPLRVLSVRADALELQINQDPPVLLSRGIPQTFPVTP